MKYVPGLTNIVVVWRYLPPSDFDKWLLAELLTRPRIGPRLVADSLQLSRDEAKAMLSDAAKRGLLLETPDGWYKNAKAPLTLER